MASTPNFASNYYNKKLNFDNTYIDGITVNEWIAKNSSKFEGNGFIFGHKFISEGIDIDTKRNLLNCIAFDNKEGGFIE